MTEYKFGKLAPKFDKRTLQLSTVLKVLPPIPPQFDVDIGKCTPLRMFANDSWGDCVIAARANQTLRFEQFEQGIIMDIKDSDVLKEYWKEQGACLRHPDNGLVVLDSLKKWRTGWTVAARDYNIFAFGEVNTFNHSNVMAAVFLLDGAIAGLQLPATAQQQFEQDMPWDVAPGPGANPGSWGGHCIYLCGFSPKGPVCETWAKKVQMTWAFWDRYADECFGTVDNRDSFLAKSPVNTALLDDYLNGLKKA